MPVYSGMALEQATPYRPMGSPDTHDLDWDAIYADQAPRVYNYFRFRIGAEVNVSELTYRTFEKRMRRSNLSRLALLTQSLSDRERELVALKYGAELTNRLIARLTGLSESNVGSILHRVVRSLREKW